MSKRAKTEVGYRMAQDDAVRCGRCAMFVLKEGGNGCTAVQGKIAPNAVCDLFEQRRG